MNPFFVTGLPRSRTAWTANWLTTDNSICHHDIPFDKSLLNGREHVGFCGPEVVMQYNEIRQELPDAPWLVLLRNSRDALLSFRKVADPLLEVSEEAMRKLWEEREYAIGSLTSRPGVECVRFEELDLEPVARSVWAHLLAGIAFDVERWRMLCDFNIQQDVNKKAKAWRLPQ
jgi:hypothetical protein